MSDPNEENDLPEYWDVLLPGIDIPRMEESQLREFVLGVVDGKIYTHHQVPNPVDVPRVFFPLLFGALNGYNQESLETRIGVLYEYMEKALPRGINGCPCFTSMRILHAEDWKRAHAAILAEYERRKNIPI